MSSGKKAIVIAVIAVAAFATLLLSRSKTARQVGAVAQPAAPAATTAEAPAAPTPPGAQRALPRLVDLGAHACIPCKMMAPILQELQSQYADVFTTEFVDVWQFPEAARRYGIRVIPTQIFLDAEGRELFRHEGYFSKADILAKWQELGVNVRR